MKTENIFNLVENRRNAKRLLKMSIVYISEHGKIPRYKSPFSGAGQLKKLSEVRVVFSLSFGAVADKIKDFR